jgi:xylulokinase
MNYFIGIDIGTSGCKALLFDENGRQSDYNYREYDIISKHSGQAELDTDEVMDKCFEVIRLSASSVGSASVRAIGISSQGEAFTILDKSGRALCNALVSSDSRANEMIMSWNRKFGEDKLYRITGHTPHPMFSLFKLLWIKENAPEIWIKAGRILCFEDLLQFRLGIANPAISWSLAGRTMLFDVVRHAWDRDILEAAGIDLTQLSLPLPSGTVAGYPERSIAEHLNLATDTLIVTGGHDQPCSALGAGAIDQGIAGYASGTVECITAAFSTPLFTRELQRYNLCTYDHAVPDKYATIAFSLTGGNILKWFRDEFGREEKDIAGKSGLDPYSLLIDQMPTEPSGLLVLPYFTPSGTPYFDVSVKGAILGLDMNVTRQRILKALLEGVAFEIRLNLDILARSGYEVNELRITGGGARSQKHVQLKADVIGKPVTIMDVPEAGCLGAAMLAKSAFAKQKIADIARRWVRTVSKAEPQFKEYYDSKYLLYRELYPALKALQ